MKAQVSIELLFNFLVFLSVVSALSYFLLSFKSDMEKRNVLMRISMSAEGTARLLDSIAASRHYSSAAVANSTTRVKGNLVIIDQKTGKTVTANTVFGINGGEDGQQI